MKAKDPKDQPLMVRVSAAQFAAYKAAQLASGKTWSAWLRDSLDRSARLELGRKK